MRLQGVIGKIEGCWRGELGGQRGRALQKTRGPSWEGSVRAEARRGLRCGPHSHDKSEILPQERGQLAGGPGRCGTQEGELLGLQPPLGLRCGGGVPAGGKLGFTQIPGLPVAGGEPGVLTDRNTDCHPHCCREMRPGRQRQSPAQARARRVANGKVPFAKRHQCH